MKSLADWTWRDHCREGFIDSLPTLAAAMFCACFCAVTDQPWYAYPLCMAVWLLLIDRE